MKMEFGFAEKSEKLKYKQKYEAVDHSAKVWKQRYEVLEKKYMELKEKAQPYLDAIEIVAEQVRAFLRSIIARGKETQEHKQPGRNNRKHDMEI